MLPADQIRLREVEEIRVAGDVALVVPETLAAIGVLATDLPLDQHAPRPVEDCDPFVEDVFELLHSPVRHPGARALGLFRRFFPRKVLRTFRGPH